MSKAMKVELPSIPDKRYFTIGEASQLCKVKPHVLRYWEQEFSQLRPNKRTGNRRYYQQKDILLIRQIRELLYEKKFTIDGAKTCLTEHLKENKKPNSPENIRKLLTDIQSELEKISNQLHNI